jgi:hypothetical protein
MQREPWAGSHASRYDGEFESGRRHGTGTFFYANGSKYAGQWVDNIKSGHGVYTYQDGHIYEGMFAQDRMVRSLPTCAEPWCCRAFIPVGATSGVFSCLLRVQVEQPAERGRGGDVQRQHVLRVEDLLPSQVAVAIVLMSLSADVHVRARVLCVAADVKEGAAGCLQRAAEVERICACGVTDRYPRFGGVANS